LGYPIGPGFIRIPESLCTTTTCSPPSRGLGATEAMLAALGGLSMQDPGCELRRITANCIDTDPPTLGRIFARSGGALSETVRMHRAMRITSTETRCNLPRTPVNKVGRKGHSPVELETTRRRRALHPARRPLGSLRPPGSPRRPARRRPGGPAFYETQPRVWYGLGQGATAGGRHVAVF
jgi:hypothetical protein